MMWVCEIPESPDSDHFELWNPLGAKFYVARRPEYLIALTGEAREFDFETAKALRAEHGIAAITFFVVSSHYRDVGEDEPEKVHIETHHHIPENVIEHLQDTES